jgi:LuxR family maltose regulon positive regulatory protein
VRDFLISEAEKELEHEFLKNLLERTVKWSLQHGNVAEAMEYALATQCPEIISKILHEIAPAWVGQKGGLVSYIKWVDLAKRVGASLTLESEYWYLWALLFARQHQAAYKQSELLWERSARDLSLASSPDQNVAFRRRFEELRILVDIFRDQTDEAGKKALKWLEDSSAQNDISMATVASCVAINATVNFDFKTARDAMHTAQEGIVSANSDYGAAWVATLSAQIDFYEGEYCHCYEALNSALARAVDSLGADSVVVSTAQLLLSSCLLQMGMQEEARKYLMPGLMCMPSHGISEITFCGIEAAVEMWDESEGSPLAPLRLERLIDSYPPPMNFVFRCFLIRRLLRLERFEDATLQAELIGIDFRVPNRNTVAPSAFVQELTSMTYLEYMLSKGMNRQAVALSENLLKEAETNRRRGLVVELEIILAILAFRSENLPQAHRHIHRAIRLAAKRRILQPFLLRLDVLRTILSQFKEKNWGFADNDERNLFQRLSAAGPVIESLILQSSTDTSGDALSGSLTARELELLRLADAGLSNQQIAERSNVALTTVKWHFSNIYSKLDVRNRSAATAKVRALNLL